MRLAWRQRGFGAIAAIVVLVILALLAAAIVSISTTQQITSAQDVQSTRAWQAARAGNEWGLYWALKNNACAAISGRTLNLTADTGFYVTVKCESSSYEEGQKVNTATGDLESRTVTVYRLQATACPVASGCPASGAAVAGVGYVERTRVVLATD